MTIPRRSRPSDGARACTGAAVALACTLLGAANAPAVGQPASAHGAAPADEPQAVGASSTPGTAVLSFDQALARALERSPAMTAARGSREVAAAQLRQARTWQNPTLEIETENVLGEGEFADSGAAETTVTLSQPLPLGNGRQAAIRGARAGEAGAEAQSELARRELRRDVAIAYADAVAADRLAAIERERARIGAETRAAVEQRFAAGLESGLQRARVAVETSSLQASARRAAAEAVARRRALAALWRDETVVERLDGAWFDAATASGEFEGAGNAAGHPRLRSADQAVVRASAALEAARAQRFNGLAARVGTRRFAREPGDGNQAFVIALTMPLPLWNRNTDDVTAARVALGAAEIEAERARRGLAGELADARAELEAADMEARALLESGLPAAESAAGLARQGYDAGRLSLLERLDAERSWSDVRERLELARRQVQRARAVLESLL
jgi:cobalt-zinc-cadmium efflux system outer membrane protein